MENQKTKLQLKTQQKPKSEFTLKAHPEEESRTKAVSYASTMVRMSPRKVLLVAESVKKLSVSDALDYLGVINKRSAGPILKTLQSAIANAKNANIDSDGLLIKSIEISQAQALKRFHPSTRGRVHPYKKRASNIRVVLEGKIKNEK